VHLAAIVGDPACARDENAIQTSVLYPAVHEFTAYRRRFVEQRLRQSERVART